MSNGLCSMKLIELVESFTIRGRSYLAGKFNDHLAPIFRKAQLLGLPISRRYGEGQGADVLCRKDVGSGADIPL